MAGLTDLSRILRSLTVRRRAGTFVFATTATPPPLGDGVDAIVRELEGFTVVCTSEAAARHGLEGEFPAAWLTLEVHSSLAAVGLTAKLAGALAAQGIACNVLAGFYHDHLLVPVDAAEEARACLLAIRG